MVGLVALFGRTCTARSTPPPATSRSQFSDAPRAAALSSGGTGRQQQQQQQQQQQRPAFPTAARCFEELPSEAPGKHSGILVSLRSEQDCIAVQAAVLSLIERELRSPAAQFFLDVTPRFYNHALRFLKIKGSPIAAVVACLKAIEAALAKGELPYSILSTQLLQEMVSLVWRSDQAVAAAASLAAEAAALAAVAIPGGDGGGRQGSSSSNDAVAFAAASAAAAATELQVMIGRCIDSLINTAESPLDRSGNGILLAGPATVSTCTYRFRLRGLVPSLVGPLGLCLRSGVDNGLRRAMCRLIAAGFADIGDIPDTMLLPPTELLSSWSAVSNLLLDRLFMSNSSSGGMGGSSGGMQSQVHLVECLRCIVAFEIRFPCAVQAATHARTQRDFSTGRAQGKSGATTAAAPMAAAASKRRRVVSGGGGSGGGMDSEGDIHKDWTPPTLEALLAQIPSVTTSSGTLPQGSQLAVLEMSKVVLLVLGAVGDARLAAGDMLTRVSDGWLGQRNYKTTPDTPSTGPSV